MGDGDMPLDSSEEALIDMQIFVEPSTAEVEEYLFIHHMITDPVF